MGNVGCLILHKLRSVTPSTVIMTVMMLRLDFADVGTLIRLGIRAVVTVEHLLLQLDLSHVHFVLI